MPARSPLPEQPPRLGLFGVWELPTGHDCTITMPAELSELLLELGR